jgi:hypothetical protein
VPTSANPSTPSNWATASARSAARPPDHAPCPVAPHAARPRHVRAWPDAGRAGELVAPARSAGRGGRGRVGRRLDRGPARVARGP